MSPIPKLAMVTFFITWLTASIAMLGGVARSAAAETVTIRVVRVIDGDTIIAELPNGTVEKIRLLGIDAPERGEHARCLAEAALAERATAYLRALLSRGAVELRLEPRRDRYGRVLAAVTVAGQDVAPQMVSAALARPYNGARRLPWCPA